MNCLINRLVDFLINELVVYVRTATSHFLFQEQPALLHCRAAHASKLYFNCNDEVTIVRTDGQIGKDKKERVKQFANYFFIHI